VPLTEQADALNISRGSIYYEPVVVSASDLALMRRMDELHLDHPFAGSCMLRDLLAADGSEVGRPHVPSRPVRLSEAEMAPPLKEYLAGMSSVTNYVNRTYSLFKTAEQRRPKQLLFKKQRG
jgi:hypothetical protein